MSPFELEVAAYAAAHRIYNGVPEPDRATPGGLRSRKIDQIADIIKHAFSADDSLASSYRRSSPVNSTVRPGAVYVANREKFWDRMPHAFDMGGGSGTPDRDCLRCGLPDRHEVHQFEKRVQAQSQAWGTLYLACQPKPLLVERESSSDAREGAD